MANQEELENEDFNDETETNTNYSELTEDDYFSLLEEKKKLEERVKKSEESLVKYKKQAKQTDKVNEEGAFLSKEDYQIEKFIDKNPDFEGKEEDIRKYLKKGLGMEEVKLLVKPNETIINREKTKQTSITAGESGGEQTTYTYDELEKMSQTEYNKVMDLKAKGKVVIKR